MTTVETVRGPLDTAALGQVLMHEHLVLHTAEFARDYPHLAWPGGREAVIAKAVADLEEARAAGIDTIVDVTAFGHGRDIDFVARVNEQVDINIVAATGYYTKDDIGFTLAPPVHFRRPDPRDVLVDMFVHDIREGIAGTGIKAGIIKCATDTPGVTPIIERTLRACAVAHRETGVPITTHSSPETRNGLDQQRIFVEEGVDLSRVIIGHSGDVTDLAYLREIMDAGSTIGADRFGLYYEGMISFEERVQTLVSLCADGYADRIVLSHDYATLTDWWDEDKIGAILPGFPPERWRLTHVPTEVVPALLEGGVTDAQVRQMMVDNPRRIFEQQDAY